MIAAKSLAQDKGLKLKTNSGPFMFKFLRTEQLECKNNAICKTSKPLGILREYYILGYNAV
jgi:hypothetical protein